MILCVNGLPCGRVLCEACRGHVSNTFQKRKAKLTILLFTSEDCSGVIILKISNLFIIPYFKISFEGNTVLENDTGNFSKAYKLAEVCTVFILRSHGHVKLRFCKDTKTRWKQPYPRVGSWSSTADH